MRGLALRCLCAGRWRGFGPCAWAVRRAPLARLARRAFGGYLPPALAHGRPRSGGAGLKPRDAAMLENPIVSAATATTAVWTP
jgi:hypothetical protein